LGLDGENQQAAQSGLTYRGADDEYNEHTSEIVPG